MVLVIERPAILSEKPRGKTAFKIEPVSEHHELMRSEFAWLVLWHSFVKRNRSALMTAIVAEHALNELGMAR